MEDLNEKFANRTWFSKTHRIEVSVYMARTWPEAIALSLGHQQTISCNFPVTVKTLTVNSILFLSTSFLLLFVNFNIHKKYMTRTRESN